MMEQQHRKLLDDNEVFWRLRSRDLQFSLGDENTSYFHKYTNQGRNANNIWTLKKKDGTEEESVEDLDKEGVDYFSDLYKEESRVTIEEVVKMNNLFTSFVTAEDNHMLMKK